MCIAVLNKAQGRNLTKQELKNCWENNNDGAGILYINKEGKLTIFKEMKNFDALFDKYTEVRKIGKNMVLHFRISTHGLVSEENCHPFLVNKKVGFVHNGMIYSVPRHKEFSDTHQFNTFILKKLPENFHRNNAMIDLLKSYIDGSKLIFLDESNFYSIVNEAAGSWDGGNWFSNTTYKFVTDYLDYGGYWEKRGNVFGRGSSNAGYKPGKYIGVKEAKQPFEKIPSDVSFCSCHNAFYDLKGQVSAGCGSCKKEVPKSYNLEKYDICAFCGQYDECHTSQQVGKICDECVRFYGGSGGCAI